MGAESGREGASVGVVVDGLVAAASRASDVEQFDQVVCVGVFNLIPAISVSMTEVDLSGQILTTAIHPDPESSWRDYYLPILETHMFDHPHLSRGNELTVGRCSSWGEVTDIERFRTSDLYRHFYGPLGVESQLILTIDASPSTRSVLAVSRSVDRYTERERMMLDAVGAGLADARKEVCSRQASTRA